MEDTNAVVAVFDTHPEADEAVRELQKSGFDEKYTSVAKWQCHLRAATMSPVGTEQPVARHGSAG